MFAGLTPFGSRSVIIVFAYPRECRIATARPAIVGPELKNFTTSGCVPASDTLTTWSGVRWRMSRLRLAVG